MFLEHREMPGPVKGWDRVLRYTTLAERLPHGPILMRTWRLVRGCEVLHLAATTYQTHIRAGLKGTRQISLVSGSSVVVAPTPWERVEAVRFCCPRRDVMDG